MAVRLSDNDSGLAVFDHCTRLKQVARRITLLRIADFEMLILYTAKSIDQASENGTTIGVLIIVCKSAESSGHCMVSWTIGPLGTAEWICSRPSIIEVYTDPLGHLRRQKIKPEWVAMPIRQCQRHYGWSLTFIAIMNTSITKRLGLFESELISTAACLLDWYIHIRHISRPIGGHGVLSRRKKACCGR